MSEQTPNSPENLQASGGEPSMEDILASIRKIISEDEPVPMESPEDVVTDLQSDAEQPIGQDEAIDEDVILPLLSEPQTVDGDSNPLREDQLPDRTADVVNLDIDAMLAEIDAAEARLDSVSPDPILPESQDDILDILDMEIPMESDADDMSAPTVSGMAAAYASDTEAAPAIVEETSEPDEMDVLLDEILADPEEIEEEAASMPSSVDNDPDLELVKSLMADLSDNVGQTEDEADNLDMLLAIPEIESEPEGGEPFSKMDESAEAAEAEDEDDILGDILNMTLEDEIRSHPDDLDSETQSSDSVAEDEFANLEANAISEQIESATRADDLPSLAEIAAAAEADAEAVKSPVTASNPVVATASLTAAGAAVTALGATALGQEAPLATSSDQPSLDEIAEHSEHYTFSQEPSMPVQAVNTDTILDDVTESAAAGAFAKLTNVVEEKAVFNERGPRIGDLVQEALRPMLKEWLDTNLKGIVERAVAKEVKRIATGK